MILPIPQFLKHTPRVMLLAVHTALNGYMTMMMMMMKITGTIYKIRQANKVCNLKPCEQKQ